MFDPDDPNNQLFLTRVFQALANINTRKILETLAQGPCSRGDLLLVLDTSTARIVEVMEILHTIGLVAEKETREGKVYVFNPMGLDLARSWLERLYSIVGGPAPK
ncbi:ArsR/SmtB family transcription factor [Bradyrhizobium betae]|uniref:ArsR/SmtB family transcription factor n=1 Tax=Bradyrhizobium betae TaxID=244734 RepID=UPI003D66E21E